MAPLGAIRPPGWFRRRYQNTPKPTPGAGIKRQIQSTLNRPDVSLPPTKRRQFGLSMDKNCLCQFRFIVFGVIGEAESFAPLLNVIVSPIPFQELLHPFR
jgi:hypothetical protein